MSPAVRVALAALLVLAGAAGIARLTNPVAELPVMLAWTAVSTVGWGLGWRAAKTGAPIGVRTVLVVAALARLILVLPAAPLSDDLYRYLWDGRVANAGINPFAWAPAAEALAPLRDDLVWPRINHPAVPTIYPPLAQLCFRGFAALSADPRGPRIFAAAADLAASALLALLLRRRGRNAGLVVAHAWCPLAMLETARGGHVDAIGVALLIAGFLVLQGASSARRGFLSGLLFGLSASVKPAAVVLAAMLLSRAMSRRRAILAGASLTLLLWIPYLDAGDRIARGFLAYTEHWRFNDALYSLLARAGAPPRTARVLLGASLLALACLAGRRVRDPAAAAGPLLFALLVFAPTVHPWYGLWVAAFLPLVPGRLAPGIVTLCALLPISYVTAYRHAASGVWREPPWPRVVLWSAVLLALLLTNYEKARRRDGSRAA